jgi:hypothetical protein
LAATALGRQEGYGRLELLADLRPHSSPVFKSTHSSLNHLVKPPFALATVLTSALFVFFG